MKITGQDVLAALTGQVKNARWQAAIDEARTNDPQIAALFAMHEQPATTDAPNPFAAEIFTLLSPATATAPAAQAAAHQTLAKRFGLIDARKSLAAKGAGPKPPAEHANNKYCPVENGELRIEVPEQECPDGLLLLSVPMVDGGYATYLPALEYNPTRKTWWARMPKERMLDADAGEANWEELGVIPIKDSPLASVPRARLDELLSRLDEDSEQHNRITALLPKAE